MKIYAALALLLAAVNATPLDIVERDPAALEKRDTEIVYLANCKDVVSCCPPLATTYSSRILYYPRSADSNNNQVPSNDNSCTVSGSSYVTWEGAARSCKFPTGVTFTSHIDSGAQSRALYSYAGSGYNGKNWNCYKDNGRSIYTYNPPEASHECDSVYYCLPQ